jgi:transcriptional regulator with XRE-family HTH domain
VRKKAENILQCYAPKRRPILKALRMARADAGLTISELAERAGVSRDTISNAEKGRHGLQATTLHKLARALDRAPSELLAEEERLAPKAPRRSSLEPTLFYGELEEERRQEVRHHLHFALDSAAESGEEVEASWKAGQGWGHFLRWMKEDAVARFLWEEWGETIGDDPEVREAQERLSAVGHRLNALASQALHGPDSPELEMFQRRYAAGQQLRPEEEEMGSEEASSA